MTAALLALLASQLLVRDEGTTIAKVTGVDCVGTGVTCSYTGGLWRLNVTSGGGGAGLPADPSPCLSGRFVTDQDASGVLTCAQVDWSNLSGVPATFPATTPVATASALAADPTACGAGSYVSDISAAGVLTCGTPAGTYSLPAATATVLGGVKGTGTALVCSGTDKATGFDAAGALQCGTDQTGGGGGISPLTVRTFGGF